VNPYTEIWWTAQSISGIPEHVMGWLVAQGWEITNIVPDATTTPPTLYYTLGKYGMQPMQVLLSLCNSFTREANYARDANEIRYNQVVDSWTSMITTSQTHFENQITEQNTALGVYLTDLDTFMAAVDALIDANQTQLLIDVATATTILQAMDEKLADLETNADANDTTVSALLLAQAGYLSTFLEDLAAKLAELDTNYSAHLTLIQALFTNIDTALATFIATQTNELSELKSNHSNHDVTSRAFLEGLGLTETARINEAFQASLSEQLQQLVDRGLYSSAVAADIKARNTRDRDEQIQMLNDRLMREKLANQHQVYGQQVDVRVRSLEEAARRQQISQAIIQWKASQLDRLLEQLQQIELHQASGIEKSHAAQQDVSRVAMAERDVLLGQLQDAVRGILAGKERYSALTMQYASTLAEHKHRAIQEKMAEYVTKLQGWRDVAAENMKLMAYQLDERNKLLVGLYSFVERREDVAPSWHEMAQMIAGLGDAAGGWITP
jgi:hypothetical protein